MHIPFNELDKNARIWVFQANRILNDKEIANLEGQLKDFTSQWAAHGDQLRSSFTILNRIHVVVGVDMSFNQASGCSIDVLDNTLNQLGQKLNVDFFDRKAVACKDENGDVAVLSFEDIKPAIEKGFLTRETITYNNLISSKEELETKWQVKASDNWLKRYFKSTLTT